MKTILCLLLAFIPALQAGTPHLGTVKQPLFYFGSETDSKIEIADVVVVISGAVPESYWNAISIPYKPPVSGVAQKIADINLASLYGIKISGESPEPQSLNVTIDASKAKVPKDYPFTVAQVVDAVSTCVKLMHPTRPEGQQKFTLKVIEPEKK